MKKYCTKTTRLLFSMFVFLSFMACHEKGLDPRHYHPVIAKEIEIVNEFEVGRLEVEIHIVDAVTGRLLGCAGAQQGLRGVDSVNVFYFVDAEFERPEGGLLFLEDIENREIEIWVIEDDEQECPGPFLPNEDDIIGISEPIPGYYLDRDVDMQFDDVVHLRIGIVY